MRWELTMRKTIIRSTTVVESGIRQVRDVKACQDCLRSLSASLRGSRQLLARLNQSLNASVARMSHYLATFARHAAIGEPRFPMAMPQWFVMSPVAVVRPWGTGKPATTSGRVS